MKIQIEDYFGNEILVLEYKLADPMRFPYNVETVSKLAEDDGYSVNEIDDNNIRLQQENVDNALADEKKALKGLITNLNERFL